MSSTRRLAGVVACLAGCWTLAAAQAPTAAPAPAAGQPPASTQALVDAARAAARADRNREAADLFGRAIAASPPHRRELLPEYADQLNYSGQSARAVPLFEEALAAPRSRQEELQSLRGLGLALLWTDRPTRARAVFERFLREQPDDLDASRNLARALSWSGRQREAIAHLRGHRRAQPEDGEAGVILAQAQAWLGRPDESARTLAQLPQPRDDARRLAADLERWRAPHTTADAQRSTQTDHLNIRSGRVGHAVGFGEGRGTAGLRLDRVDYDREDGSDSARVTRPMVTGRYRISDAVEVNAEAGTERVQPRGGPTTDTTVYATWFTWWPNDLVRLDLSASRASFDNLQSLRLGLAASPRGLSMDVTPTERQRYTVRLEQASYSDGNNRRWAQLETEYRWRTHPDAWLGLRHTRFEFDRELNNGYFNPSSFRSTQLTWRTLWRPDGPEGRWDVAGYVAFGREHAQPGGSKPATDVSLRAGYRLDAATRLEARAQHFTSRTAGSGFARTIFGAALERSW
jgi:tetratricopeptide (TPR) repeat protein